MCENIFRFLNYLYKIPYIVPTFISLIFLIFLSLCMHFRKMGKIHSEWKRKDKLLSFIEEKANILIYIILTLVFFWFFNFIFLSSNIDVIRNKIIESYGLIFSTFITVFGVFAGFVFNKRQTYKEIVTRERIEWLHKMQEALAEFLALTSENKPEDKVKEAGELYNLIINNLNVKKDKDKEEARKLYYLIISNLNVKEDKEKKNKNERDAVELLYNYAISKGLDVELNFNRNLDSDEDKDSNDTKSIDELKKEKEKLIEEIKTLEDKIKNLRKTEEVDPLAGLKRKEIISKYTEIFNETWNRIKKEAD